MDDRLWTILMTISVSCSAMLLAWDRGWLAPAFEVLRHPVRTVKTTAHNVRVMLRG